MRTYNECNDRNLNQQDNLHLGLLLTAIIWGAETGVSILWVPLIVAMITFFVVNSCDPCAATLLTPCTCIVPSCRAVIPVQRNVSPGTFGNIYNFYLFLPPPRQWRGWGAPCLVTPAALCWHWPLQVLVPAPLRSLPSRWSSNPRGAGGGHH